MEREGDLNGTMGPALSPSKGLKAFRRDERGVTAIEFGIVSVPLFGLIFAIFQSSLSFMAQQGLRVAVDNAARKVMTGQAQSNSAITDSTTFRDQLICSTSLLPSFVTCSKIIVDVRSSSSFATLGKTNVNSTFVFDGSGAQYSPGVPCQIMVVRIAYPMPSYLPLITWGPAYSFIRNMSGLSTYNGQLVQMLSAASVFRNEPFVSTNGQTSCSS